MRISGWFIDDAIKEAKVKYYPYRKARLLDAFFSEDILSEDSWKIQKKICKKLGVTPDNHTVVVLDEIAIAFEDGIRIGYAKNVEEK